MSHSAADWSNYWRGRTAEASGAALVGAGIEDDAELKAFWQTVFAQADPSARVLDLACGAGSALKQAEVRGLTMLAGADISADALSALEASIANVKTCECSADDTPFEGGIFDYVVSQFGIEYAGLAGAAKEVGRLLAPGGRFAALVHIKGGGIEQEVARRLHEGEAIRESNFIPLAKNVFTTAQQPRNDENMARAKQAGDAFQPAEQALSRLASENGGLAAHLYQGTRQMYERVMNYELSDIHGWLDAMQGEIDAYIGRMSGMLEAAASEDDVRTALQKLVQAGCDVQAPERFQLGGKDAAWVVKAVKS